MKLLYNSFSDSRPYKRLIIKRLIFGLNSAPEQLQDHLQTALADIFGVIKGKLMQV